MGGALQQIDSVDNISTSETNDLTNTPEGTAASMVFLVDVTAITGTWRVQPEWRQPGGGGLRIANLASITTTGLKRIPLGADFNATRNAIFHPTRIAWLRTSGNITAKLYFGRSD